jgi:DNA-binding PadR family transcriptional regulator
VAKRGGAVELAVLGLLHESPMHGYELRKRVSTLLGWGRVLSYGSLYPALKQMRRAGWLTEAASSTGTGPGGAAGRRGKIIYKLTPEGKQRFEDLMSHGGPSAWEDDSFGVHFAFFAKTDAETRMRILEGRRLRMEERLERVRTSFARSRERVDAYTMELQRHGLESVEREVSWLSDLIDDERSRQAPTVRRSGSAAAPRGRRRRARRGDSHPEDAAPHADNAEGPSNAGSAESAESAADDTASVSQEQDQARGALGAGVDNSEE